MTHKTTPVPRLPGIPVNVDGEELIVPSLTVAQFKQFFDVLTGDAVGMRTDDYMMSRLPAIGAALRRNYPDLSDEILCDKVDLANFRDLVKAVQAASGMKPVKPGESLPTAEASTGTGSKES